MPEKIRILLVSLDKKVSEDVLQLLKKEEYLTEFCDSIAVGLTLLQEKKFNVVLLVPTDEKTIDGDAAEFLHAIKRKDALIQILVVGKCISLSLAVQALECGANDFILLPAEDGVILKAIQGCIKKIRCWQAAIKVSIKLNM